MAKSLLNFFVLLSFVFFSFVDSNSTILSTNQTLKIGLVFPFGDDQVSKWIETTVNIVFENLHFVNLNSNVNLTYEIYPTNGDSSNVVFAGLDASVNCSVIFGESTTTNSDALRLVANRKKIPQIVSHPRAAEEPWKMPDDTPFLLQIYPRESFQANIVYEILKNYRWEKIVVLFDQDHQASADRLFSITEHANISVDYQSCLYESHLEDISNRIISSKVRIVVIFADRARRDPVMEIISKLSEKDEYVFLGNDDLNTLVESAETPEIAEKRLHLLSITQNIQNRIADYYLMKLTDLEFVENDDVAGSPFFYRTHEEIEKSDLIYTVDAFHLLIQTLNSMVSNGLNHTDGALLMNSLRSASFDGATGHVSFDSYTGERISDYNVMKWSTSSSQWLVVGSWNASVGISLPGAVFPDGVPLAFARELILGSLGEEAQLVVAENLAIQDLLARDPNYFYGIHIKIIYEDVTNTSRVLNAATSLVHHNAVGVIGASSSDKSYISQLVLANAQIPQISPSSTSPTLSDRSKSPYFVRTIPSDTYQGIAMARICHHFGWSRVAAIASNDLYGSAGIAVFLGEAAVLNITVAYQSVTGTDVQGPIAALKAFKPKIFVLFASRNYAYILKEAKSQGLIGPGYVWFGSDFFAGVDRDALRIALGNEWQQILDGVIGTRPILGTGPRYDNLVRRLRRSSLDQVNPYAGYAYDAALVLGSAIHTMLERGQNPHDGPELLNILQNFRTNGTTGEISLTNGDRNGLYELVNWRNDSWFHIANWESEGGLSISNHVIWTGDILSVPLSIPPPCQLGYYSAFTNGSYACLPCGIGYYTPSSGSDCAKCPPGTFTDQMGAPACLVCEPGSYQSAPGSSKCLPCAAGFYNKFSSQVFCDRCDAGTFSASNGSSSCAFCPVGSYANDTASSGCQACPPFKTTPYPGAHHPTLCACRPTYYLLPNGSCVECPHGARCQGGDEAPVATEGFWSSADEPNVFLLCVNKHACPGGTSETCHGNFTGRLCSHCSPGYYESEGNCEECSPTAKSKIAVIFIAVSIACVILTLCANWQGPDQKHTGIGTSLGIMFNFLQVLAILSLFNFTWPSPMSTALKYLRYVIVDLDVIITPSCSFQFSYYDLYLLRFFSPLIFLLMVVITYGLTHLHKLMVLRVRQPFARKFPSFLRRPRTVCQALTLKQPIGKFFTEYYPMEAGGVVNASLMFLDFVYIYMVSTGFEIYRCYPQNNGTSTLLVDSTITCYSPEWTRLLPLSVLGLLIYGLGTPLLFGTILYRFWKQKITESDARTKYGYLTCRWKRDFSFWQMVLMARKFLLSFVISTFATTIDLQFLGALVVLYFSMLLHKFKLPYKIDVHNSEEFWVLQISVIYVVICIFLNIPIDHHPVEIILSYTLLAIAFLVIGIVCWCTFKLLQKYRLAHFQSPQSDGLFELHTREGSRPTTLSSVN